MKFDKVVRAGINGCGNIVVEQILHYLLGKDKVISTFRYLDNLEPNNQCHVAGLEKLHLGVVIPERDFRSALASQIRKRKLSPTRANIQHIYDTLFSIMYRNRHQYTTRFPDQNDILILDYRLYFDNINYILNELQRFLEIIITVEQREEILQRFSRENNKRIAKTMPNWQTVDPVSGVHGMHIGTSQPDSWKTFFPPELHEFVTDLLRPALLQYGWKTND